MLWYIVAMIVAALVIPLGLRYPSLPAGGILGLLDGFLIAALSAPPHNPAQKLANEWYILAAFACAVAGLVGGAVVGLVDGLLRQPGVRWRSLAWGLAGSVIGSLASAQVPTKAPEMTAYYGVAFACLFALVFVVTGHFVWRHRHPSPRLR